ncbi:MAG: low molecular weight phosphatase family protein [Azospirillum sp.]|nr:low molecular weight phosphatase family protein [Azospirillum sp.]
MTEPAVPVVTSVLFACTYNAIRSPMAEGLFRHFHGKRIYVDSVGVREAETDPFAVAVMEELGIDISRHRPKTFDQLEDSSFDLVVSLSPEAQHRAIEMVRTMACDVEYWRTFDPTVLEGSRDVMLGAYRQVRDGLMQRILKRFPLAGFPNV